MCGSKSSTRTIGASLTARNGFSDLLSAHGQRGIVSVCSAHPWAIRAAADQALADGGLLLIEATCNQVNPDGGYTGMRPEEFRDFVRKLAAEAGLCASKLMLGGDHLGPHVWRNLKAEDAMRRAEEMVAQYARAGFGKIHLDTSMPCGSDPDILPEDVIASRAARLAQVAEASRRDGTPPFYIVGTEVPTPGGASQGHALSVTTPEAAARTLAAHQKAFAAAGLADAWGRVVGLVVQPGVEFDNISVADYQPAKASQLARWREESANGLVFEAHSTDFQRDEAYVALVRDGFAILKVGPGVTFAMREAISALAEIEKCIIAPDTQSGLLDVFRAVMHQDPRYWRDYYTGTPAEQDLLLFNSYSDRIRYYWPDPRIEAALARLIANLTAIPAPDILLSRHLPVQYRRVREGQLARDPKSLILDRTRDALRPYAAACRA